MACQDTQADTRHQGKNEAQGQVRAPTGRFVTWKVVLEATYLPAGCTAGLWPVLLGARHYCVKKVDTVATFRYNRRSPVGRPQGTHFGRVLGRTVFSPTKPHPFRMQALDTAFKHLPVPLPQVVRALFIHPLPVVKLSSAPSMRSRKSATKLKLFGCTPSRRVMVWRCRTGVEKLSCERSGRAGSC